MVDVIERYKTFRVDELSYGTVEDYCDSVEHLLEIASINNDLKDQQRCWMIKAIIATVPHGGHLLEVGAGDPWVAAYLVKLGYKVDVIDPYDGRDRGPSSFEEIAKRYPDITFYRGLFPDALPSGDERYDGIYSISVLEHIDVEDIATMGKAMKAHARSPTSRIIHTIDFIQQGPGSEQAIIDMREWMRALGFKPGEIDLLAIQMLNDPETYYLSAASHNMWRGGVPYSQYRMRRITSTQVCVSADHLR